MIATILDIFYSRPDRAGNRYWAFTHTDTATGRSVSATICGGEANITGAFRGAHYSVSSLPIRQFDRMVKNWGYAGCTPDELRAYVENHG